MRKTLLYYPEKTVLDSSLHGTRLLAAYTAKAWNPGKQCIIVCFPGVPFEGSPHPVVLFYLRLAEPVIWCFSALCLRKPLRIPKVIDGF